MIILLFIVLTIILHVCISLKICRGLHYIFNQKFGHKKVYLYQYGVKKCLQGALFKIWCIVYITWIPFFFYSEKFFKELFIAIFISTALYYYSSYPDKDHVFAVTNLHMGYGAASAYYNNYLALTMTERFSERINKFNSENMIQVPKKLFILVPESCRVHNYLDSIEYENIERCRELPDEEISHGGIKNRKYNITIYNVNGNRMAIEFAQPLKALYLLKNKNILTMDEMLYQRKLFLQTLKEFLKLDPYKYFIVVEYNDSIDKIDKVLTNSYCSLSNSCNFKMIV